MNLVIFDLDGTLVDTMPAFTAAWRQVAPGGRETALSAEELKRIVARERTYSAIFRRQVDTATRSSGDVSVSDIVSRLADAFRETYPTEAKLYPGVYRLLMTLENQASCAIVGSAPTHLLDEMVDYFGLEGYVDHAYSMGTEDGSVTEVLADWSREHSESAMENVIWVSSRAVQLETARQEGVQTAYASYGYGSAPEWGPDHFLDRLSSLFSLFSRRD